MSFEGPSGPALFANILWLWFLPSCSIPNLHPRADHAAEVPPLLSSLLLPGHGEGSRYHFWDVQRAPPDFLAAPEWFHTPTRCFIPHSFPRSHIPAPGTSLVPLEVRFVSRPGLQMRFVSCSVLQVRLGMFLFIPGTSDTCRDRLKVTLECNANRCLCL